MTWQEQIRTRLYAMGWHLLLSILVVAAVAGLVFGLWFPGAYRTIAGGTSLLLLIMAVDVVMGPILTFSVFDQRKGNSQLKRDLMVIVALQMGALLYGLYSVQLARPVALVFEYDRFRVISAAEVLHEELHKASPEFTKLPWTGPWVIAVRKTERGEERNSALMAAILDGVDTSQRPTFWVAYSDSMKSLALEASKPISVLLERYPENREELLDSVRQMALTGSTARYLPVAARGEAVAVLDRNGDVAGFLMKDGFF